MELTWLCLEIETAADARAIKPSSKQKIRSISETKPGGNTPQYFTRSIMELMNFQQST